VATPPLRFFCCPFSILRGRGPKDALEDHLTTDERTLTIEQARAFYDRMGRGQDAQYIFEDRAIETMIAHADFPSARAVLEFGCGTGRIAERLLNDFMPPDARYLGIDISTTMVTLARDRLERFGARAEVRLSDGSPAIDTGDDSFDRFVTTSVLDLMSRDQISAVIAEAYRVLEPEGLLGLVSLTHGFTAVSRFVSRIWSRVHRMRPSLVGGCRPIELTEFLDDHDWRIVHRAMVSALGFPSEVVVAASMKQAEGSAARAVAGRS
jgi:ubiquinone/menaquinone biosynthesis C-methylase UbiE